MTFSETVTSRVSVYQSFDQITSQSSVSQGALPEALHFNKDSKLQKEEERESKKN